MPSSRFSGLYLSGRALAVLLVIVGVAGAMAFYRSHATPAEIWAGITHATDGPLASSQVGALTELSKEQELLAERVAPAVVQVNVTAHSSADGASGDGGDSGDPGGQGLPPDNPLSQFLGHQFPRRPQYDMGLGSGIIISPDGFIVTNNHVVQDATSIRVSLTDKREFPARVVGTDALTDLAVIKINASGLPNLPWGDSKAVKQGDEVYAFGNPFTFQFTMTHGIISGKGRLAQDRSDLRAPGDYLQTDAAINPGNSGGPLVDTRGEVIGVNAFIYTSTGSFSGEAFAIPSEIAKPISALLIAKGKVVRGYLGITIVALSPDEAHFFNVPSSTEGALVSDVTGGAAGARAGLKYGDLIVSFNGQPIADPTQLQLATGSVPPGTTVKLGILRDGKPVTLDARLGIAPQDENATASKAAAPQPSAGVALGVALGDLTAAARDRYQIPDNVQGVLITGVTPGGPAFNAGIIGPGLVITDINRVPVTSAANLRAQLQKLPPGDDVLLRLYNGGPQAGATYFVIHPAATGGGR
ncbi:MAG TPA: trypsin-like peptidase domain-containing protein [Terriglobales bacterium]|nr:trypsin-like peptidase domain-containing protein [Terriglobales bacterium]